MVHGMLKNIEIHHGSIESAISDMDEGGESIYTHSPHTSVVLQGL